MQSMSSFDQMTLEEKLRIMEQLWDNLCQSSEPLPSPDWHHHILLEREQRIATGKATFTDWTDAKTKIRSATT